MATATAEYLPDYPLDYVVVTHRGGRRVAPFGNFEFAKRHALANAPGEIYRADQIVDPDRGFACRTDRKPVFTTYRR